MKIIALAVATVTIAGIYVARNGVTEKWTTEVAPLIEEKETPKIDFELNLDVLPDNIDIPDPLDTPLLVLPPVIVYPEEDKLLALTLRTEELITPKMPEVDWHGYMLTGVMYYEGYYRSSYYCAGGRATIGYGCTNPKIVSKGSVSRSYAKEVLSKELKTAREHVLRVVSVDLNKHQLCALTSFTFNCGLSNLKRLVDQPGRLNDGNYKSVEYILPKYRKAGGHIRRGLEKRRMWELKLWRGERDDDLF